MCSANINCIKQPTSVRVVFPMTLLFNINAVHSRHFGANNFSLEKNCGAHFGSWVAHRVGLLPPVPGPLVLPPLTEYFMPDAFRTQSLCVIHHLAS